MSIIERTTRLLLTQFKGNSIKPAILEYYNSDMKKIDDAFIDADNRIISIESSLSSYSNRLDTLELESESTITELADHETRLQSIESIIETVSTANIEDLRRRLDAVEIKVDTNATAIESLNEDVNLIEASVETIHSILNTLDSRISVNENNISSLQTCCETVQTTLINLQSQITANDSDITELQNRITTAENNIQGNATDITTVATQTRVNTTDIAELKTKVNNLEDAIQQVDNWEDRIEAVENTVAGYDTSIAQAVSDSANALDTANAATLQVDGLDSRVTTVESNVTAIDSRVTTAENDIDTAEADINALKLIIGDNNAGLVKDVADIQTQNGNSSLNTTAQTISGAINELDSRLDDVENFNGSGSTSLLTKGLTIAFKRKAGWVYANVTGTLTDTITNGTAWNEIVPVGYRPSFDAPSSIPNLPTDITNSLLSLTFESDGVVRGYTANAATIQNGQTVNCKLIYPCA